MSLSKYLSLEKALSLLWGLNLGSSLASFLHFLISAFLFVTEYLVPGLLADFFDKKRCLALRAGPIDGPVPNREGAGGICVTGIKGFALFGPLLDQIPFAVFSSAFYP